MQIVTEQKPYTFRISTTYSNVRIRECEHCGKRTKQQQGQDANGKWVEKFRCLHCLTETT